MGDEMQAVTARAFRRPWETATVAVAIPSNWTERTGEMRALVSGFVSPACPGLAVTPVVAPTDGEMTCTGAWTVTHIRTARSMVGTVFCLGVAMDDAEAIGRMGDWDREMGDLTEAKLGPRLGEYRARVRLRETAIDDALIAVYADDDDDDDDDTDDEVTP